MSPTSKSLPHEPARGAGVAGMGSAPVGLMVCSHFPFPANSGGRKRSLRLIEAVERSGIRPIILSTEHIPEGLSEARDRGWAVELFSTPSATLSGRARQHLLREEKPSVRALRRRIGGIGPEVAFVQFEEIQSAQYVRCVPPGTPSVVSLYNVDSQVAADLASVWSTDSMLDALRSSYHIHRMRRVELLAARRSSLIVAVSERDAHYFAEHCGAATMLVPNGVDDELFSIRVEAAPDPVVFFFGQFAWPPNADGMSRFLKEGWPCVKALCPQARLRICGPHSREALSDAASTVPDVTLLGTVPDVKVELTRARVVVVPIWVGGGTRIKVLEALAAGRPVVGTPIGVEGIGFENEVHGLIEDSPDGLARATAHLLEDVEAARGYALAGRELVERRRWEVVTEPLEKRYAEWGAASRRDRELPAA
jgi:glycosyltransferase involved in cell wall biosynthesis